MHIVLIRFSSMGDIVIQSAFVAWLRQNIKNLKITFITSAEFSSLLTNHPFVDQVITHERAKGLKDIKQLKKISHQICELNPDFIIDLHGTLRAKLIKLFTLNIPHISVAKRSFLRFLLVKFKIDLLKDIKPQVERTIEDFSFLTSSSYELEELSSFVSLQTKNNNNSLTTLIQSFDQTHKNEYGKYIVISPVASFIQKRWPIERFIKLLENLLNRKELEEFKFVIVGGNSDNYCQELSLDPKRVINLQGNSSLEDTNKALKHAALVVTNDTGVGHMAEALGVKTISIFGPTSPSFGFRPYLKESQTVYANVKCSPCSNTGGKACSKNSLLCMEAISVESIEDKIIHSIGRLS